MVKSRTKAHEIFNINDFDNRREYRLRLFKTNYILIISLVRDKLVYLPLTNAAVVESRTKAHEIFNINDFDNRREYRLRLFKTNYTLNYQLGTG